MGTRSHLRAIVLVLLLLLLFLNGLWRMYLISLNLHVNIYSSIFECVQCSIMDIKYNKFYSIINVRKQIFMFR